MKNKIIGHFEIIPAFEIAGNGSMIVRQELGDDKETPILTIEITDSAFYFESVDEVNVFCDYLLRTASTHFSVETNAAQ
jgi:hypothetical protein